MKACSAQQLKHMIAITNGVSEFCCHYLIPEQYSFTIIHSELDEVSFESGAYKVCSGVSMQIA